jgi:DNA polymerase V
VGVFLQGRVPETPTHLSLFTTPEQQAKEHAVSATVDAIKKKWGRGTSTVAAVGKEQPWRAKQAKRSPRYTTRLAGLPVVN